MTRHSAIVFPGQGSQSVGMIKDLYDVYPVVRELFNQAADILHYDLWHLVAHGPAEQLNQTTYTQPALLTASYAVWRVIQERTHLPIAYLAGHSLGEYTALVCAEALAFENAVALVAARGQFMQEAVPDKGAMAAIIGLDEQTLQSICQETSSQEEIVSPANINSPGQIVIAGHLSAVHKAMTRAKTAGAKLTVLLPVSVPSHCELMRPAAMRLDELLKDIPFATPKIPVIKNVDVLPYTDATSIRLGLTKQLYQPVQWIKTITYFVENHINTVIECGPGKVLTNLNKRIQKDLTLVSFFDCYSIDSFFTG